jgi:Helix-turn-helix domain
MLANPPPFAAIPLPALRDPRLSAIHLRVLGAVAWFDRISMHRKKGQSAGCFARGENLAAVCGVHRNNVSTAVTELVSFGYLARQPSPDDKRRRVLRVLYPSENTSPVDEVSRGNSSSTGVERFATPRKILRHPETQVFAGKEQFSQNINTNINTKIEGPDEDLNKKSNGEAIPLRRKTARDHVLRDGDKLYIRTDSPHWSDYEADYRAVHGVSPEPDCGGGRWFKLSGEAT